MSEVSAETSKKQSSIEKTSGTNEEALEKETRDNTESTRVTANEDVQRAIEGLAEIADEELQEFLNDEDFMKGLDVVDAWRGDAESETKPSRSERRTRDRDRPRSSRERPRKDRRSSHNRERLKREERRRDDARRDPSKSSKDIERDKMRTKKDTASKILAEKEKAIKQLLDSDDVVPPGTEVEAIKDITEKQQINDRGGHTSRGRRSRERRRSPERPRISPRRRSNDRIRLSPVRRISPERRHARASPERRRKVTTPLLRRSWERRASRDRSMQRRQEERDVRIPVRRSRSRDRHRSRSVERYRKRWSRSPIARRSNSRRRSRTRSRTPERRARKRSPFINEIARQLAADGLLPSGGSTGFLGSMPPLLNPGFSQDQGPPMMQQFMHSGPGGPPKIPMQGGPAPPSSQQQNFVNFDQRQPLGPPINYDQPGRGPPLLHTPQTDYSAGPIMYNQGNPPLMQPPLMQPTMMPIHPPQPVPAPVSIDLPSINFNPVHSSSNVGPESHKQRSSDVSTSKSTERRKKSPKSSRMSYKDLATGSYNGASQSSRQDRLKTPEPPVISNSKPFERTSLSSLLEASVSAKDLLDLPVFYPGIKPEILRQCEQALRDLPPEDLRFRSKGRFFFDPSKKDETLESDKTTSNSILLRTGGAKINWDNYVKSSSNESRQPTEMRQKICQTDMIEQQTRGTQCVVNTQTTDFCAQVYPNDLQQTAKEEKRPIMDRLDWNIRESYEPFASKIREADDLRWSLSNASQKRPGSAWPRGLTPTRIMDEERQTSPPSMTSIEHTSRNLNVSGNPRTRDNYSFDRSTSRERYSRDERFSPNYRRSLERRDDYRRDDGPSDHSRGESPMALDDSPDEVEILEDDRFSRSSDWRARNKTTYPPNSTLHKIRNLRGKPYRGRGGFRGKF